MTITVGTIVDVKDRTDLTQRWGANTELRHYGIVIELLEKDRALVRLRFPKKASEKCPHCDSTYGSVNMATGEVSCDDGWGCGRGFGFNEREEIIPLDRLINISVQRDQEVKRELRNQIEEALEEGLPQTCHYRDHVGNAFQKIDSMARAECPKRHSRLDLLDARAVDQLLELLDELLEL